MKIHSKAERAPWRLSRQRGPRFSCPFCNLQVSTVCPESSTMCQGRNDRASDPPWKTHGSIRKMEKCDWKAWHFPKFLDDVWECLGYVHVDLRCCAGKKIISRQKVRMCVWAKEKLIRHGNYKPVTACLATHQTSTMWFHARLTFLPEASFCKRCKCSSLPLLLEKECPSTTPMSASEEKANKSKVIVSADQFLACSAVFLYLKNMILEDTPQIPSTMTRPESS